MINWAKQLGVCTDELTEFFTNVDTSGNIMEQYQAHLAKSAEKTSRFANFTKQTASILKSFGTSLSSIGINMLISAAIEELSNLANAEKEASEKAKASYEESNLRSTKYENDLKTLDGLIKKYKELYDSGNLDSEKQSELEAIQGKINELVGYQVNGLDLVNGKFDEQLEKLKEITAEQKLQAYYNSIANYNNSKKVSNNARAQEEDDNYDYIYRERDIDSETLNILERSGFIFKKSDPNMFRQLFNFSNEGFIEVQADYDETGKQLTTLEDKLAYLKRMQKTLLLNGKSNTGIFNAITAQIQKWEELKTNKTNSATDVVKFYLGTVADSSGINSVDAFIQYRNKLIDDAKNNPSISQIIADGVLNEKSLIEAIDSYMATSNNFSTWFFKWKNGIQKTANKTPDKSKPKTFNELWDSIGTSGNVDADKTTNEEKEKILELAEAGKLTEEKLQNSSISDVFTEAGISIEEATEKLNNMKSSASQLSSMKAGISSISSILAQKEENQSSKETHDKGIGADTLAGMPDDVKAQTKEYEHFVNVLGNGKSKMSDCKDAANKLATAYINSNNFLANLTEGTEGYYTSVLEEMGVENAAAIVRQSLNEKKANEALLGWDIVNATDEEIAAKANEINAIAGSNKALKQYIFQKALAGKDALKTSGSIRNLIQLAKQCGITGKVIREMNKLESLQEEKEKIASSSDMTLGERRARTASINAKISAQEAKVQKLANRKSKVKTSEINIGNGGKTRTTSNNKDPENTRQKETKQTIDWIERRLGNLQRVIDLTAAKFQNIFKIGKQKSNLDKQIKTTKQLIKEYGLAAEKYQTKANKIAAGKKVKGKNGKKKVKNKLSKSIIKKVKAGKLTKKTKPSSLIKAYGSEKAEQIQSYIDYNDKAQSAKKSKVEQITKQRELEQQKLQLDVDLYNERISRAEAKEAVAIGAKKKNASVNKQIKNIQLSYDKQIAIAELTKGAKSKAEIDRLNYEKQKKITDLKVHQIDNIKKDYENKISPIDNAKQKTQNEVSLLEAKGRIVTANYYRKQNDQEINKRNTLQNELKELQGKLKSGTFTEYSDEWYQLQSDIQSVENSINECNVNIIENSKKLGELHNAMLEDIAANNTRMSSEADFLAGLMGSVLTDENGNGLTKEGMGVLGTYGIGMEAAEKNAKDSADERKRLENLLSSHSYGRTNDEYQSEKSLRDKIAEVAQKQQEYTKTAYDYETKIADLMKENYQAQLDYMKKIIDAKKNVLSLEKDLYDYERNISDQTKNIAALEKQYAALQGDDSEEGRAKRSSLQASIDEARQELQDTEYDKYISDQQNMLDNLYTEYEDLMNNLFKNQDQLLKDGIDAINENGTTIKSVIDSYADSYGYNYTEDFSSVMTALGSEGTIVTSMRGAINGDDSSAISQVLKDQAANIIKAYQDVKNPNPTSNPKPSSSGFTVTKPDGSKTSGQHTTEWTTGGSTVMDDLAKENAEDFITDKDNLKEPKKGKKKSQYSDINQVVWERNKKKKKKVLKEGKIEELAGILGIKYNGASKSGNLYKRLKQLKVKGFKHGGIAKLVKSQGEDGLAMVRNGEGLISPENVAELQKFVKVIPTATDLLNNMKDIPIMPNLPTPSNTFGDIHFDKIELPNVQDVDDFVTALQTDKKVQRALGVSVHDLMTKGRITSNIQKL